MADERATAARRRSAEPTDKLKAAAKTSRWELPQLHVRWHMTGCLSGYLVDEGWVVKGATALLARI